MTKNNNLKNEWDLLLAITAELKINKEVVLFSVCYQPSSSEKTYSALSLNDEVFLAEQKELEWVLELLHGKFEIVVLTNYEDKSFSIYLPENTPEHTQNFPF